MIKGTNANCKVVKVSVTDTQATITLLIFATSSTNPSKAFQIYIKDEGTSELIRASDNVYWIDQTNNYNYDSTNIDTKKYKEIMFTVDITNSNKSKIDGLKWVRNIYVLFIDTSKHTDEAPAWSSDLITLVSDEFEIPTISNILLSSCDLSVFYLDQTDLSKTELRGNIKIDFKLKYISEKDFNYNNENFSAYLNIRSVATDNLIESKQIQTSATSLDNTIITTNKYSIGQPVIIQLLITNKNGDVVNEYRKIYTPFKKYSNTYIKTTSGIKKVVAYYVVANAETEHEGTWVDVNDTVIKPNYNNAVVKRQKQLVPTVISYVYFDGEKNIYHIEIDARLNEEPLYEDFVFEVYFNDVLVGYITPTSEKNELGRYVIDMTGLEAMNDYNINVTIKGKYTSVSTEYQIGTISYNIVSASVCQEELCCSEDIFCNNYFFGYLNDGVFYEHFENGIHQDEVTDPEGLDAIFINQHTMQLYKWNSNENKYQLLY